MIEQVNFVGFSGLHPSTLVKGVDIWDYVVEAWGLGNNSFILLNYLDEEPWFPQLVAAVEEQEGYDSKLRTILEISW